MFKRTLYVLCICILRHDFDLSDSIFQTQCSFIFCYIFVSPRAVDYQKIKTSWWNCVQNYLELITASQVNNVAYGPVVQLCQHQLHLLASRVGLVYFRCWWMHPFQGDMWQWRVSKQWGILRVYLSRGLRTDQSEGYLHWQVKLFTNQALIHIYSETWLIQNALVKNFCVEMDRVLDCTIEQSVGKVKGNEIHQC